MSKNILFMTEQAKTLPFTCEFMKTCRENIGASGVYCFSIPGIFGETIVYVGKSDNLGSRLMGSYTDKLRFWSKLSTKVRIIKTQSPSDAAVLELYFINKYKPVFNKRDKSEKDLSLSISPIPDWSEYILVLEGGK